MSRGLGLGLPYHELRLPRSAGAPGTLEHGPMLRLQVLIGGAVAQLSFGLISHVKAGIKLSHGWLRMINGEGLAGQHGGLRVEFKSNRFSSSWRSCEQDTTSNKVMRHDGVE